LESIKAGKTYIGDVALGLAVILTELTWQPVHSNNADEEDDDDNDNDNNNNNNEMILLYCYNSVK